MKARHELLTSLAALQPAWTAQLGEASKETLAVWLCSRCGESFYRKCTTGFHICATLCMCEIECGPSVCAV